MKFIKENLSEILIAKIKGNSDYPDITGKITFKQVNSKVNILVNLQNLPENKFLGFHIHKGNTCTGNDEDEFKDVGKHYNPSRSSHPEHAGDLPILYTADGNITTVFETNKFTLDEIKDKTIIIHEQADDFKSQPAGNSGEKIACGEITEFKLKESKMKFLKENELDELSFSEMIKDAKERGVKTEDIFEINSNSILMNPDEYLLNYSKDHNLKTLGDLNDLKDKTLIAVKNGRLPHKQVLLNYLNQATKKFNYDKIPPATLNGNLSDGKHRAMLAKLLNIKLPVLKENNIFNIEDQLNEILEIKTKKDHKIIKENIEKYKHFIIASNDMFEDYFKDEIGLKKDINPYEFIFFTNNPDNIGLEYDGWSYVIENLDAHDISVNDLKSIIIDEDGFIKSDNLVSILKAGRIKKRYLESSNQLKDMAKHNKKKQKGKG